MVEGLDENTLQLEKDSHVNTELSEYFSDTVYTCRFHGTDLKIALLFEHKSSPEGDLPFQLHRYMANVWDNSEKSKRPKTPVVPIVVYHGKQGWNPGSLSSRFRGLPISVKPFVPDFEYIFVNLSAWSDETIKQTFFTVATLKIALLLMKHIWYPERLSRHLKEYFELGSTFFNEKRGLTFLQSALTYLFQATNVETDVIVESISDVSREGGKMAMSTAEQLRKEGLQKGSYSMAKTMVLNAKKQGMKDELIAQILNLDITSVHKLLNNEKIDIPLHILDSDKN